MGRLLILLMSLLVAIPAVAKPPGGEEAKLRAASERGALLFALDQAAWKTTDDMLERFGRQDMPIKGWVIERDGPQVYRVTYYGDGGTGPVTWYVGRVRDGAVISGEIFPEGAGPPLTPAQLRLKQAADVARASTEYRPCTPSRFNVAVVPPDSPDAPIDAYLLSAQTEATVYPVGGHYLLRIGPGGNVLSHRPFMKSCMNADVSAKAVPGKPVSLVLTHILDPIPTEIHVWTSLAMRMPIVVGTANPRRMWSVDGGRIRQLRK